MSLHLLGGVFLGWSLGANDAANVFGTAVASRMVRLGTAGLLCALFVILGALLEGQAGIETIGALAAQNVQSATFTAVGAALSITIMTLLRIPSSTSQAVVGSIIGIGWMGRRLDLSGMPKVIACWVGTPIGALLIAALLYRLLGRLLNALSLSIYRRDVSMRAALIVAGCYGAYALGANNVANVTGVYFAAGMLGAAQAAAVGGVSIAIGVLTYSHRVMLTVGRSIVRLDAFAAFIVVLAEALTVHAYAWVGVPVSTSQAVVGAVIGVGLVKQASAVRMAVVAKIFVGWVATPLIAALISMALFFAAHLRYVPAG